ncbi:hypothetical protein Tco_0700214 [Tanacetum coccineum]
MVYKMGKSSQTLRLLTNEQGLYRDNTRKLGLGNKDPCFLKQAVACNLKLYHGSLLCDENVHASVYDSEEILDDAKESRFKMKDKQILVNYAKINKLYDTFVPQTKLSLDQKTAKFEVYFGKLKNTKVVLERQLARKVDDSKAENDQFLKEINLLRTQLKNMKGKSVDTKFDKPSILGKPPSDKLLQKSQLSKSWFAQRNLSKLVTQQSLPKNEKDQFLKQIVFRIKVGITRYTFSSKRIL